MPPGDLEKIHAYITGYGHLYTHEVLTRQLRDAGYSPADIDATWAALEAEDTPMIARLSAKAREAAAPVGRSEHFWTAVGALILLSYLLPIVIWSVGLTFNQSGLGAALIDAPLAAVGGVQVAALILALTLMRRNRALALGLLMGLLLTDIVLPLLAAALLFGFCMAGSFIRQGGLVVVWCASPRRQRSQATLLTQVATERRERIDQPCHQETSKRFAPISPAMGTSIPARC